jgi:hypothetical protein
MSKADMAASKKLTTSTPIPIIVAESEDGVNKVVKYEREKTKYGGSFRIRYNDFGEVISREPIRKKTKFSAISSSRLTKVSQKSASFVNPDKNLAENHSGTEKRRSLLEIPVKDTFVFPDYLNFNDILRLTIHSIIPYRVLDVACQLLESMSIDDLLSHVNSEIPFVMSELANQIEIHKNLLVSKKKRDDPLTKIRLAILEDTYRQFIA